MSDYELARQAKALHSKALLGRRHVVGVGVGFKTRRNGDPDGLSVVVLVRQKLPPSALADDVLIPKALSGIPTDVIEVGDVRALAFIPPVQMNTSVWTGRQRPAQGGNSIGHYQITAGTLGCVVRDRRTGKKLILSNNHVLANCNAGRPGDPILQPGPADGGQVGPDTLASLERFIPIRYGQEPPACSIAQGAARVANVLAQLTGSRHRLQAMQVRPAAVNHIDAALARPLDEDDLLERNAEIGLIDGYRSAQLGMPLCKAGRTTAFTTGAVTVMDASVQVGYTEDRLALFESQILTTPMSQGGDSGSLIVSAEGHHAVGLLFAGSPQVTIFNPIGPVLETLQIDLPGAAMHGAPLPPSKSLTHTPSAPSAQAVRLAHQDELLKKANVVGVGVGQQRRQGRRTGQTALVVMVTHKVPLDSLPPADRIPSEIDGIPVDVQEVGAIRSL